ncbi:MAG: hypothetical protein IIA09_19690 [Proteobacteria bacterium]|jgi:hypothetical protein|nr:hypothetical protein [Pseudomonadota bacterium]
MQKAKVLHDQVQLSLFHPRPSLPRWSELPTEVRETSRDLFAQVLTAYLADHTPGFLEKEIGNE